jgi:low affinity Fe/Cu permease
MPVNTPRAASDISRRRNGVAPSSDDPNKRPFSISGSFNAAAQWTSRQCGRASTFAVACALIVVWAVTGPVFQFSDTWQLVINTGTTIVTFLMVFLIQNTQNRDSAALHLKLDELIRVNETARNKLLDLEDLTEAELEHLKGSFTRLASTPADQPCYAKPPTISMPPTPRLRGPGTR